MNTYDSKIEQITVQHSVKTGVYGNEAPIEYRGNYKSATIIEKFSNVDEFIAKYPPTAPNEKLIKSIQKKFYIVFNREKKSDQIVFNYGKGNVTFYFIW